MVTFYPRRHEISSAYTIVSLNLHFQFAKIINMNGWHVIPKLFSQQKVLEKLKVRQTSL